MLSHRKGTIAFVLLWLMPLVSCFNQAERDNPLDPDSGRYRKIGGIEGHVYTYYAPFRPLASAFVMLLPEHQCTVTNSDGAFEFKNLKPGQYQVTVRYPDYAVDTSNVEVVANTITPVQFNLNGLPQLDTLILLAGYEHVAAEPLFSPTRLIQSSATVHDPDGFADIASVTVTIPRLGIKKTLSPTQAVDIYSKRIEEVDLPVNRIEELIGQPFYVEIKDRVGAVCRYGPSFMTRVIAEEAEIISPHEFELVGNQPRLQWNRQSLPYFFNYRVEIFVLSGYEVIIPALRTYADISREISEFNISKPLPPGAYLWTVYVVDRYGNWSRSKPATFQVGE